MRTVLSILLLLTTAFSAAASARDEIPGPVDAEILRVIDGDTLLVEAMPWPQQKVEVYVRIRGIDTPETRSKCMGERQAGQAARRALEALAEGAGVAVRLSRISGDKYFGRVVADVTLSDGVQAADHLLLAGLADPYDGGRKQKRPCVIP